MPCLRCGWRHRSPSRWRCCWPSPPRRAQRCELDSERNTLRAPASRCTKQKFYQNSHERKPLPTLAVAALHRHLNVTAGVLVQLGAAICCHLPARASRPPARGLPGMRCQGDSESPLLPGRLPPAPPPPAAASLLITNEVGFHRECVPDHVQHSTDHVSHAGPLGRVVPTKCPLERP